MNNNKECPICLDELSKQVIKLNCGHFFHPNCINDWKKINNVCPVCREKIDKIISLKSKTQIIINCILFLSILTIFFYFIKSKRIVDKFKINISNISNLINNITHKYQILNNSKDKKIMFYNLYNNLPNIFYNLIFFKENLIINIPNIGSYIKSVLPKIIMAFGQRK